MITSITKSNLIDEIIVKGNIAGKVELTEFLKRIWDIDSMPSTDRRYKTATEDIWKHMFANDDWSYEYLLKTYLNLPDEDDSVFMLFLEQLVHPLVRRGDDVEEYVNMINKHLLRDGYKLETIGEMSGYPIFKCIKQNDGVKEKVKNLIFSADGPKPEIVIDDALSNNIRIVKNEEFCLVYDLPIPDIGLSWTNLVSWWAEKNKLDFPSRDTSNSLYKRLEKSLDSVPEILLFTTYYKYFSKLLNDKLPALIPQVYLHYDPYTLKILQGLKRLPRQRMDFLLLISNYERIVIEVDGKQHYSEGDVSSPRLYSEMVQADRELRLRGYEVYRFGGHELQTDEAKQLIIDFFNALFLKHNVIKNM